MYIQTWIGWCECVIVYVCYFNCVDCPPGCMCACVFVCVHVCTCVCVRACVYVCHVCIKGVRILGACTISCTFHTLSQKSLLKWCGDKHLPLTDMQPCAIHAHTNTCTNKQTNKQTHVHLSSFDMMISCVWLAEVRAEKLSMLGMYLRQKKSTASEYMNHDRWIEFQDG